jgi:hypothetical protein
MVVLAFIQTLQGLLFNEVEAAAAVRMDLAAAHPLERAVLVVAQVVLQHFQQKPLERQEPH